MEGSRDGCSVEPHGSVELVPSRGHVNHDQLPQEESLRPNRHGCRWQKFSRRAPCVPLEACALQGESIADGCQDKQEADVSQHRVAAAEREGVSFVEGKQEHDRYDRHESRQKPHEHARGTCEERKIESQDAPRARDEIEYREALDGTRDHHFELRREDPCIAKVAHSVLLLSQAVDQDDSAKAHPHQAEARSRDSAEEEIVQCAHDLERTKGIGTDDLFPCRFPRFPICDGSRSFVEGDDGVQEHDA